MGDFEQALRDRAKKEYLRAEGFAGLENVGNAGWELIHHADRLQEKANEIIPRVISFEQVVARSVESKKIDDSTANALRHIEKEGVATFITGDLKDTAPQATIKLAREID